MWDSPANWPIGALAVALGVGLLIGTDRERKKGTGRGRGAAGIRTFSLVALLGAASASLESKLLIAVFAAAVVVLACASYVRTRDADPGLTTEVALVLVFALGVISIATPALAAGLGVLVALLLASRTRLHEFVRHSLSDREILDGILLAAAALIVLPLLPNRAIDPYGVLNPQVVWRLTVVVLLLNAFGYVALRSFGPHRGLAIAGFFGGFVSSAATIGTYGARARREPALHRAAVAGAALSCIATAIELAIILAIANHQLLQRLSFALALMGLAAALYGIAYAWLQMRGSPAAHATAGRAFQLRYAVLFALSVSGLLLLSAFLADRFGSAGAGLAIVVAGFADAHSASASAARLLQNGTLDEATAVASLSLAVLANGATKIVVAWISGGWRYVRALAPGIALSLLAFLAGALLETT